MNDRSWLLFALVLVGCNEDSEGGSPSRLTVAITGFSAITDSSARVSATIADDGGIGVLERGICWSRGGNPTIDSQRTIEGTGHGSFASVLRGLSQYTSYKVRAYATNDTGTAYSHYRELITHPRPPRVRIDTIAQVTNNSAMGRGSILSDGFQYHYTWDGWEPFLIFGFCWSTASNPTISNSRVSAVSWSVEDWACTLVGLLPNTTYFVRAFAYNAGGTGYSNTLTVMTDTGSVAGTFVDIRDGRSYRTIRIGNQVWMAENLNYGTATGSWYYDNDSLLYSSQYGRLYDWLTAVTIAPAGWHLPRKGELDTLLLTCGGITIWESSTAFDRLVFADQSRHPQSGTTGFNAAFGGRGSNGQFSDVGQAGYVWSSTEGSSGSYRLGISRFSSISLSSDYRHMAYSVRCIRD